MAAVLSLGSFAAPAVFATGSTIRITDGLDPVELRIRPGTTVTFRNDDGQRHRLRSRAGARFDTGNIEPGEARSIQFTVTGRYPYVDERDRDATPYHGTIVVTASGGAGPSAGSTSEATAGAGGAQGGAAPASATIHFAGRRFSPSSITVRAGATITFRNDDDREHTASATLGAFETGVLTPGASGRVKLASPGSYRYVCLIHPDMTGTITVAAASGRAAPAAPTSAPTTAPTAAPTTVPATPPATAPTPDPTPETTPGPTILEAGIGAAGPPDDRPRQPTAWPRPGSTPRPPAGSCSSSSSRARRS